MRLATAGALASILSFGAGHAVDAAPGDVEDPPLELLVDAAAALGRGDTVEYEMLLDLAERGVVWVPTAALDALNERDVEDIGYWIFVLDADDELLLDGASDVLQWEYDALEALAPGATSNPVQTQEINDADFEGAAILEVIDYRNVEIPESARLVLAPLPVDGDPAPSSDEYIAALTDLDALIAGETAVVAPPAPPETTIAPAETATASIVPDETIAEPQVVAAPAASTTDPSNSSNSSLPMIAVAVLAALALAVGSFAMLRGRKSDQLADIAFTDGLTGLKNRRRLDADVAAQRERGERATASLMIDVDHFKAFNDTHGHAVGDEVLRLVGDALRAEFRRTDVPYRYGGEEFCVLLNDVTPGEAVSAGERARAAISAIVLPIPERITVSIGVSIGPAEQLGETIKRADAALYDAKSAGRDRVTFASV